MKRWDVFISHASEDRQAVALPLAASLIRAGLKVWLDRFELKVGDSLRERIDEGLSESVFGVVVLSENFLNKGWPKRELNGLFALEEEGAKVILPVWHGVDKVTVSRYSPILADRLAADTKDGIPAVARMIAEVILGGGSSLRSLGVTLASRFIEIVNDGPEPAKVGTFLTTYRRVLQFALGDFGLRPDGAVYRERPILGDSQPDLTVGSLQSTAGDWGWKHFFFCPVQGPFFERRGPAGALKQAIGKLTSLQAWLSGHAAEAGNGLIESDRRLRGAFQNWRGPFHRHELLILAGRRDNLSQSDRETIRALRDGGVVVRSYDWLIEACAMVDEDETS